jgi:GNAT superfamily N-acetyltransferase
VRTRQIAIERATAGDEGTIALFRYLMFADMHPEEDYSPGKDAYLAAVASYYERHLGDPDQATVFVVVDGRKAGCGTIMFQERPVSIKYSTNTTAYILNVYVLPEYRRMGIATMVMEELRQLAKAAGVRRIGLHASEAGRPVYEKLGYRSKDNYLEIDMT